MAKVTVKTTTGITPQGTTAQGGAVETAPFIGSSAKGGGCGEIGCTSCTKNHWLNIGLGRQEDGHRV